MTTSDQRALWNFLASVLRWRYRILVLAFSLAAIAAIVSLASRRFMARSEFLPQKTQNDLSRLGSLGGLVTQLGLPGMSESSGESVDFYAELLKSRGILVEAARTVYRVPASEGSADTVSGSLIQLYRIKGKTPAHP